MFGTIRRHQKWLWALIITLTIISFVWFFGPEAKMRNQAEFNIGSMNGHKFTREEYYQVVREVRISAFISQGKWTDDIRQMDDLVRQRLFFTQKMREYNIKVSDEALAQFMKTSPLLRARDTGAYSPAAYEQLVAALPQGGVTEDDLFRFFRYQVGINQLVALVQAGAIVPPRVAEAAYKSEHEQVSGNLVFLAFSNYTSITSVDTNKLTQYYTNHIPEYMIPPKAKVKYVSFAATNYLAEGEKRINELTNLTAIVESLYQRRGGTNSAKDKTEAQVKEEIKLEIKRELALETASSNAVQFANAVYSMKEPMQAAYLDAVAAQKQMKVLETEPFTDDGPKGLPESDARQIAQAVFNSPSAASLQGTFKLTADNPISQRIMTTNAVYIVALDKTIPRTQPPFEDVRERVLTDYKHSQALDALTQAGMTLQKSLSEGVAQGKSFKEICDALKVKPIDIPMFSISTRKIDEIEKLVPIQDFLQGSLGVPAGRVGRYTPVADDGGFIFFAKERKAADDTVVKLASREMADQLRQDRQGAIVDDWANNEFSKSGLAAQKPAPTPVPGAAAPVAPKSK